MTATASAPPMTPTAILASLRAKGIRLWVSAVKQGVNQTWSPRLDPAELLTAEDKALLSTHRAALLAILLAEPECAGDGDEFWVDLPEGAAARRALFIIRNEADLVPASRDVRFFDAEPKRIDLLICPAARGAEHGEG